MFTSAAGSPNGAIARVWNGRIVQENTLQAKAIRPPATAPLHGDRQRCSMERLYKLGRESVERFGEERRVVPGLDVDGQAEADDDEPARGDHGQALALVAERVEGVGGDPVRRGRAAAQLRR